MNQKVKPIKHEYSSSQDSQQSPLGLNLTQEGMLYYSNQNEKTTRKQSTSTSLSQQTGPIKLISDSLIDVGKTYDVIDQEKHGVMTSHKTRLYSLAQCKQQTKLDLVDTYLKYIPEMVEHIDGKDPKLNVYEITANIYKQISSEFQTLHVLRIFNFVEMTLKEYQIPLQYSNQTLIDITPDDKMLIIKQDSMFITIIKIDNLDALQPYKYLYTSQYFSQIFIDGSFLVLFQLDKNSKQLKSLKQPLDKLDKKEYDQIAFNETAQFLYFRKYGARIIRNGDEIMIYDTRNNNQVKYSIKNDLKVESEVYDNNFYLKFDLLFIDDRIYQISEKLQLIYLTENLKRPREYFYDSTGTYKLCNTLKEVFYFKNGFLPFSLVFEKPLERRSIISDVTSRNIVIFLDEADNKIWINPIQEYFQIERTSIYRSVTQLEKQNKTVTQKKSRKFGYTFDRDLGTLISKRLDQNYYLLDYNAFDSTYLLYNITKANDYVIYDRNDGRFISINNIELTDPLIGKKENNNYQLIELSNQVRKVVFFNQDGRQISKIISNEIKAMKLNQTHKYFIDNGETMLIVDNYYTKICVYLYDLFEDKIIDQKLFVNEYSLTYKFMFYNGNQLLMEVIDKGTVVLEQYTITTNSITLQKSFEGKSFADFNDIKFTFIDQNQMYLIKSNMFIVIDPQTYEQIVSVSFDQQIDNFNPLNFEILFDNIPNNYCNQYLMKFLQRMSSWGFQHITYYFEKNKVFIWDLDQKLILKQEYDQKTMIKILNMIESCMQYQKSLDFQISSIKEANLSLSMLTMLMPSQKFQSLLHWVVVQNPKLLNEIKTIIDSEASGENEQILFIKDFNDETPLDVAIKDGNTTTIKILLNWLQNYQSKVLLNYIMDKHLTFLLENNFSIKDYLESEKVIYEIKNNSYIDQSKNNGTYYFGINQKHLINFVNDYNHIENKIRENEDGQKCTVEYFVVNLPTSLTENPLEFMMTLSNSENIDIFNTLAIQTVINYKWKTYTKNFFVIQLALFTLFLAAYIIDLYFFAVKGSEGRELAQSVILKAFCLLCLVIMVIYELVQIRREKRTLDYLLSNWNFLDTLIVLMYPTIVAVDLTNSSVTYVTIAYCLYLIILFFKLCFFLRIFDNFSFLVAMILQVFKDVRVFLVFYFFVVALFGIIFAVLIQNKIEDLVTIYTGVEWFSYFILAFRASIGDFQIDSFYQLDDQLIIFTWIIWFIAVILLNLILLNFIIAVISESYENTMANLDASIYKMKAQLIKEREYIFTSEQLKNPEYFPRYILLRRPFDLNLNNDKELSEYCKEIQESISELSKQNERYFNQQNEKENGVKEEVAVMKEKVRVIEENQNKIMAKMDKLDKIERDIANLTQLIQRQR